MNKKHLKLDQKQEKKSIISYFIEDKKPLKLH